MLDYRLFYPKISIDDQARVRRPISGHAARRVYQLQAQRPNGRNGGPR